MNDDNSTLFDNSLTGDDSGSGAAGKQTLEKGATLLGLYKVKSDPIEGGMGRVFRVHHPGWNVDLAMKQPKAAAFMTGQQKEAFTAECQHWIDLGLHPHIVSCYYVREIDGIPGIFSEWMEGGSLKQWIYSKEKGQKGRLYAGDDQAVQERILDIAIQFARGLHYANEQGLIHQDVKPDNLLMTSGGLAKVADFGIANASARFAGADNLSSEGGTMVSNGITYTERYCSPEQIDGRELTRRTDIWSWAVSVLEMYAESSADWANGVVAGYDCDDYINKAPVPVPDAMKDLLRGCFAPSEADRPHDFGVVETGLLKIYESVTGHPYPRPQPNAADNTADNLNNHALSFIDIGKPEEAERCWEEALALMPNHAESIYNQSIHRWKKGEIDDMETVRILTSKISNADYHLGMLHLARADAESAIACLKKAIQAGGETDDIKKALAVAQEMKRKEQYPCCIRTFQRHTKSVYSVCFSPDGKRMLSENRERMLSEDGFYDNYSLELWDAETGNWISTFWGGHTSRVFSVCFSPDGKRALSGSSDKTLKLWDAQTGKCIRTFNGHTNDVYSVCFSPDGKWALSGSSDHTLKLWDTETGECIRTFQGHTNIVCSVCFNPDGQLALSGSDDHTLKLWYTETGECIHTFQGHTHFVRSVCFNPDGRQALSGSWDKTLKLWDIQTGKCIRTFRDWVVYSVCFSPDGRRALSGGEDTTLKLWNTQTGECIRTFQGHADFVRSVCFSPDGRWALSGSEDKTLKLWRLPDKEGACEYTLSRIHSTEITLKQAEHFASLAAEINKLIKNRQIVQALVKLEDLKAVRLFGDNQVYYALTNALKRYCMISSCATNQVSQIGSGATSLCFSPDGRLALSGSSDYTLKLWDTETGECIRTFQGHIAKVLSICFSPNGQRALSGSLDRTLMLWDAQTGACLRTFKGHTEGIESVCFSPDGQRALSGSWDKTLKLWDAQTGACLRTFKGHTDAVKSVCFSPDGRRALSGSRDKTLKLWGTQTGACLRTFQGHTNWVYSVCFSPDGRRALSGSEDKTLKLWDTRTGKCLRTFQGHDGSVLSVCFSPDGQRALSGSGDNTLKLWDIQTGECIYTFKGHTSYVPSVCFSPDGNRIASASDKNILIHDLEYDLRFPGWADWDEGAQPYLEIFLTLHPNWTDEDFEKILIPELQHRGYGWLRPEGVRAQLERYGSQNKLITAYKKVKKLWN